jgi:hypothetical protein
MSRILLQQAFIALRSAARNNGNYLDYSDVADAIEAELAKPETPEDLLRQSEREGWRYAKELEQELAKPEQASNEPPDYVEPPTSDYHNGWEEGFEAAKNLFKGKNT